jgi:hypothetical protein
MFFQIRIRIRIRILRQIFCPEIFLNGVYHCSHMCSGTCTTEKKSFPIEKNILFLLYMFDLQFLTNFFYFTTVPGSEFESVSESELFRIRIRPKLTDSFGFGSTTLVLSPCSSKNHWVISEPGIWI